MILNQKINMSDPILFTEQFFWLFLPTIVFQSSFHFISVVKLQCKNKESSLASLAIKFLDKEKKMSWNRINFHDLYFFFNLSYEMHFILKELILDHIYIYVIHIFMSVFEPLSKNWKNIKKPMENQHFIIRTFFNEALYMFFKNI